MPPFTILLIDDHAMFRAGLRVLLEGRLPAVRVLEAASIDDAERLRIAAPDLLLLDIQLQEGNGLDGMSLFRQRWPDTVIAVLSAWHTPRNINQALAQGARTFIPKTAPADAIMELVERLRHTASGDKLSGREKPPESLLQRTNLTPRQREVLALLRVSSRSEAVFVARSLGLTD